MPKAKASKKPASSDSDSGPEDRGPAPKAPPAKKAKSGGDAEENTWELGKDRSVKLTEFKGKWYVNIREYYQNPKGEMCPSKKGIMLTMEQWQKFKAVVPEIEEAVKANV